LSHLAFRAPWGCLFLFLTVSCTAELEHEVESDCHMEVGPAPDEPGGWGAVWRQDDQGALLPEVLVHPLRGATLWMDVRVTLPSGREIRWTEDLPASDEPFSVPVQLPPELDAQPARVRVRLTAVHPETGRAIGRQATRAFALRQGDLVHLSGRAPSPQEFSP
jgi:hypothetical protein